MKEYCMNMFEKVQPHQTCSIKTM